MVPSTRRRLLQAATAMTGGLAGCSEFTTGSSESTGSDAGRRRADGSSANTESDPPVVVRRAATERPPIALGDRETETSDSRPGTRLLRGGHAVIDSRAEAERLTVAPGIDGDEVTAFVDETDFQEATLYLETDRVRECFRHQLCSVSWQPTEVDTSYVRQIRAWDEACTVDERVLETRLIRIPAALNADEVNGFGTSTSSGGSCDDRRVVVSSGSGHSGSSSGSGASAGGSDR